MNLDELSKLADAAEMMPWDKVETDVPFSARYALKEAVSSQQLVALIAVARAAQAAIDSDEGSLMGFVAKLSDIRSALAELGEAAIGGKAE